MVTMYSGIKAREVILGKRGGETVSVVPSPKPVVEFHGWVLREKIKMGLKVVAAMLLGGIAVMIAQALDTSFWFVVITLALGFLVGFIAGGDTETAP